MAEPLAKETIISPAVHRLRSSLPEPLRSRLRSARELDRELRDAAGEGAFPTAVPALDRLLDGGLPRGQLVELVGSRTSGRFSTAPRGARRGHQRRRSRGPGRPRGRARSRRGRGAGIDLERLLWVRPPTLKEALAAAEMLIGGGFPLVVLDLGHRRCAAARRRGRLAAAGARRPRARVGAPGGSPYRVSGTAAARGAEGRPAPRRLAREAAARPGSSAASPRASCWRSTAAGCPGRPRSWPSPWRGQPRARPRLRRARVPMRVRVRCRSSRLAEAPRDLTPALCSELERTPATV